VRGRRAARLLGLGLMALMPDARAELPAEGERITNADYALDLGQTPVLSGNRVTGLAGAFVAIGEGTDGSAQNPAAVALRTPWSTSHVDLDVGLGITVSSTIPDSDVFNSGQRVFTTSGGNQNFLFVGLALNVQIGRWGFGVASDIQQYTLSRGSTPTGNEQEDELAATFAVTHWTAAHAFHDGELLLGLGTRSITLNVNNANAPTGGEQDLFEALGAGYEAGVLFRPNDEQYRIGAAFRSAVTARASRGTRILYEDDPENMLVLPNRVTLPWELHAGVAVQLGPRPFNPEWLDPDRELAPIQRYLEWRERERERRRRAALRAAAVAHPGTSADAAPSVRALDAELETEAMLDALHLERAEEELGRKLASRYFGMDRFYLLLSASLQVLGPVGDAVGVESFLERQVQRSGRSASVSPRLGVETEAVPNWTRIRAGSYFEPTRFESNPNGARVHATLGLEQRLFPWTVFGLLSDNSIFRITGSLDVARDYIAWGVAIGMWH
jgi:hypothetical protein